MASLAAGLTLRPNGDGSASFLPPDQSGAVVDVADARQHLVRRFLRLCGPASAQAFSAWIGVTPAAVRRWWAQLDLVDVDVDGRTVVVHAEDVDLVRSAAPARAVRLLPPYDPLLEVADRELLLPDPRRRREVWRPSANPGLLLVGGKPAGVWRRR
ncbi:DNA glycosylase AlkZ-like family protein, partial [Mycobacterium hubeiense]|uniref:DNA glycosylase AlkZ-like family protein n=1 Tax=Mycobacterium hubeiense TaxID=1867256 RepID=UPI0011576C88